jgi:hypothetical protein
VQLPKVHATVDLEVTMTADDSLYRSHKHSQLIQRFVILVIILVYTDSHNTLCFLEKLKLKISPGLLSQKGRVIVVLQWLLQGDIVQMSHN